MIKTSNQTKMCTKNEQNYHDNFTKEGDVIEKSVSELMV